jgi:uncharacterized protein YmfQ (DUF2313 family)
VLILGRWERKCALADHVSLVLGSGGEHVKRQRVVGAKRTSISVVDL